MNLQDVAHLRAGGSLDPALVKFFEPQISANQSIGCSMVVSGLLCQVFATGGCWLAGRVGVGLYTVWLIYTFLIVPWSLPEALVLETSLFHLNFLQLSGRSLKFETNSSLLWPEWKITIIGIIFEGSLKKKRFLIKVRERINKSRWHLSTTKIFINVWFDILL